MTLLLVSIFVAVAIFAVVALVVVNIIGDQTVAEVRLAEVTAPSSERITYGLSSIASDVSRMLRPVREFLRLKGEEDLGYRLSLAGYRTEHAVDNYLTAKLLFPVLGVLLATFTGSNFIPFSIVLGGVGFFVPNFWVSHRINKRKKAIALSLPDAMDLLVICMEAGLGADQAMLRVAQEMKSVSPQLSEELMIISREQRAGKPRVEAWRSMADRVDLDTVRQFAGMLAQSERLGTPIAQSLGQFADLLRAKRLLQAEERAAKTPVKLIPPLVIFIMPAVFVVILGPAIITFMKAIER